MTPLDASTPARQWLRSAFAGDLLITVSRGDLGLPADVVGQLAATHSSHAWVEFQVEVNAGLKVPIVVKRIASRSPAVRMLAALDCALSSTGRPASGREGRVARARRRLRRAAHRALTRVTARVVEVERTTSPALNAHLLTDGLHRLSEFAFPAAIHVALTKNCNLKCVMCPYHAESLRATHTTGYFEAGDRMPHALLERLIEETGRHGAHLSFGQYDEPFVYKGFADWAVKARRAGCSVSITTNGTLLGEAEADALTRAGVDQISFSLDAATPETYRVIRLDDFEIPLRNLRTLVAARDRNRSKTKIRACFVVQDQNRHERDAFYALMGGLGLDMVSFYNLSVQRDGVWLNPVLNFDVEDDSPARRSVCSQLYDQMAVYPDGSVALCCLTTMYVGYRDDVPYVGNLKDSALRDIWMSPAYMQIRQEAFRGVFSNSVCRDCTIWHNYQGRESVDERGNRTYRNAYETVVYLRRS